LRKRKSTVNFGKFRLQWHPPPRFEAHAAGAALPHLAPRRRSRSHGKLRRWRSPYTADKIAGRLNLQKRQHPAQNIH
jgi:hypothetical protein